MKSLALLSMLTFASCASATVVSPYEAAAVHAHAIALRSGDLAPAPAPALRCGGDKIITHGDGHTSPCPGCVDCQNKVSLIESVDEPLVQPAVFERVTKISQQCADGSCAAPATILLTPTKRSGGSCASGSCGTSTVKAGGPVRKVFKGIRERRPVRRLFGRLFGRR